MMVVHSKVAIAISTMACAYVMMLLFSATLDAFWFFLLSCNLEVVLMLEAYQK